ncbi:MAG: hypothetical protein SFX18_00475 [Pirellulales bacterium]|nr:hypothetical protein [Pirellulales bacterium]
MKRLMGMFAFLAVLSISSAFLPDANADVFIDDMYTPGSRTSLNTGADVKLYKTATGILPTDVQVDSDTNAGGLFKWTGGTWSPSNLRPTSFNSYCIELVENLNANKFTAVDLASAPLNNNPIGPANYGAMGAAAANWIGKLFSIYGTIFSESGFDPIGNKSGALAGLAGTLSAAERASALQLAIWEISYDKTSVDLNTGFLRSTATTTDVWKLANKLLNDVKAVANSITNNDRKFVLALQNAGLNQDQLISSPNGGGFVDPVPEPATLVIWGLIGGIGAIVGTRYTRNRKIAA